ncbi:class I SAM-dependent methyltransferase [Synechococcus sp. CS-205]|uniref:class I SAM-dependent methyltransferase n=1 Tax=Synechococcus sp. CS-205 TaxID=2847984 RepID=UPI00223A9EEC|nr:SAM-dependent methyltransferase [Synechococcus sp. CS-205]MCT0249157.1 SAM-dependent methyltransferase [Synechococcus sp. CS-205]
MPLPAWLEQRLLQAGGSVPFRTYMEWVLHDPEHGAYGAGRLSIGPRGDFATAPSLGPDFAALLAPQIARWLQELPSGPLSLVEAGPGEGSLAAQLAEALMAGWPQLAERLELVLVEPNAGMAVRQRQRLQGCPLPVRWSGFAEMAAAPLRGVVLAHEVLDALSVERIERSGTHWCRQQVTLQQGTLRLEPGEPLEPEDGARLEPLGLLPLDQRRPEGWCSELHPGLAPWMAGCGAALAQGRLLVIDYALEAWRYYAPQRSNGTLMAYRAQQASSDPLLQPGEWDLTAHLCLESVLEAAAAAGWQVLGQTRQGEALLALGLAQRLHGLQQQPAGGATEGDRSVGPQGLAELLARREALLRLVDPAALGDFRWLAFSRGEAASALASGADLFLQEPGKGT